MNKYITTGFLGKRYWPSFKIQPMSDKHKEFHLQKQRRIKKLGYLEIKMKCAENRKLSLTCPKDWRCDLNFTCGLIRLKSRSIVGAQFTAEYLWALSSRGAGAGTISSMVWILLIKHCYELATTDKGAFVKKDIEITTRDSTRLRQAYREILTAMYPRMLQIPVKHCLPEAWCSSVHTFLEESFISKIPWVKAQ